MENNIVTIDKDKPYRSFCIQIEQVDAFFQNPDIHLWNVEDDKTIYNWLNKNIPGWRYSLKLVGITELQDPEIDTVRQSGKYMRIEMFLYFQTPADQMKFDTFLHIFLREQCDKYVAIQALIDANPDKIICVFCGTEMLPEKEVNNHRVAQFCFSLELDIHKCPMCEGSCSLGGALNNLESVMNEIEDRVGLPRPGNVLFTKQIFHEKEQRRNSPPVITIAITRETSSDQILSMLDDELKKLNVPVRGFSLKLVK